jgi:hypothetical protein
MTKTNISVNRCESVFEKMQFEKTKPIYSFSYGVLTDSVLRSACCEWIPAFAGITKTNISVNRRESVFEKMQFEKTKPIFRSQYERKCLCKKMLWEFVAFSDSEKQSQFIP